MAAEAEQVAWVSVVTPEEAEASADEPLMAAYKEVMAQNPHGKADNVMRVHSLRPATMTAHLRLYKSTLHNPSFTLPFVFLEAVYAMVSHLNGCTCAPLPNPSRPPPGHRLPRIIDLTISAR